jgi:hypothetical protein
VKGLARSAFALAAIVLIAAIPRGVGAQDTPPVRPATVGLDEKQMLRVSVGYRDVVDRATAAKLRGGLPTTIVMSAYVFREGGSQGLAATFMSCRVIYDLWNEVYNIELTQPGAPKEEKFAINLEGVLRHCTESDRLLVAPRATLSPPGSYYLGVLVEVNPVSPEMLDRIKRWVSRPTDTAINAPGDALFGSFVGLFAVRPGRADRQITFRTQSFTL